MDVRRARRKASPPFGQDKKENFKMSDSPNSTGSEKKTKDAAEVTHTSESENEEDSKPVASQKAQQKKEKAPPKKQAKKEEVKSENEDDEEEDEEDEDDDDDESEKKVGLLDQPLEVSGSRERKKVERLEMTYNVSTKEKKTDIPEGSGEKLGDCPRIEFQIQKTKTEDLKNLHRILFNRPGSVNEIKKNIRRFNGFPFRKKSPEYDKKKGHLDKLMTAALKKICEIIDLERSGTKEEIVTRILDFLVEPKASGKAVPQSKKKTPSKSEKKKRSKTNAKTKSTRKRKSKADDSDSEAENDVSESEEASEKEDKTGSEEEDGDEEDNEEVKKKATNSSKDSKGAAGKKPKKEAEKDDKATKGNKKRRVISSDEDNNSSDDEPLVKKAKQPPTDEELKALIKSILDGANLEEITMKTVCKQVYANYPEFDLADRKEFIKVTVRSIIS